MSSVLAHSQVVKRACGLVATVVKGMLSVGKVVSAPVQYAAGCGIAVALHYVAIVAAAAIGRLAIVSEGYATAVAATAEI